jgi:hypothetical protein
MKSALLIVAIVVGYAVLGLAVLDPDAVYSGDIGVKFVQASALTRSRLTSLDIPYPGEFLDHGRQFFPLRPPFVMSAGGATQAIFSPVSALLQAVAVAVAGFRGMTIVSLVAAAIILAATRTLAGPRLAVAAIVALGLAGPLWFYAVTGWEHAPAVAFGTAAFACAVVSPTAAAPLLAGILLGAGTTLRDEVLLLAPGLVVAVWVGNRRPGAVLATVIGVAIPLILAGVIEVWWFHRPPAAHLRHAVHFVQSALGTTDLPNPDVPVLRPMTLRERYETVVQYWLLGYGNDRVIIAFAAALAVALLIRWRFGSSVALLAWLLAVIGLAAVDVHELVTAPKWLAGLHRVSPFFAFALFPRPKPAGERWPIQTVALVTTAAYLLIAFAGVDTTGGKSLGPRLLLPLFPLLAVAAVGSIASFLSSASVVDKWTGRAGIVLVLMAVMMHTLGTVPAYIGRNRDDALAVRTIAGSDERIVVSDDPFTAQLLFPLYYRKIVLLADSPALATSLGHALAAERSYGAMLVSRRERPAVDLAPLRLERADQRGRMVIQYWRR